MASSPRSQISPLSLSKSLAHGTLPLPTSSHQSGDSRLLPIRSCNFSVDTRNQAYKRYGRCHECTSASGPG
ncbi:uncharacterized protein LY79DRAFT_544505 [Colletotrichum navitas]|uniref:Uncharacterized protein n=1 Tax=Colletotrichum navitas TaxID=681940 RepID=A0AAD8Q5N2_9PEZI|nr:uncharacterized protein LY79DRAFT_544505 [Colletotrichum navitas]KAK1596332.1 hypothetical protein LY79DRAFT_544505 [Colletotrichum navitas]